MEEKPISSKHVLFCILPAINTEECHTQKIKVNLIEEV